MLFLFGFVRNIYPWAMCDKNMRGEFFLSHFHSYSIIEVVDCNFENIISFVSRQEVFQSLPAPVWQHVGNNPTAQPSSKTKGSMLFNIGLIS